MKKSRLFSSEAIAAKMARLRAHNGLRGCRLRRPTRFRPTRYGFEAFCAEQERRIERNVNLEWERFLERRARENGPTYIREELICERR